MTNSAWRGVVRALHAHLQLLSQRLALVSVRVRILEDGMREAFA